MSNKVQNNKKIKIKKPSIKNQYLVHFLTLVIPFYNKPNQFSFIFEFIINARKKQNKVNSKRHIDKSLSFVMAVLFTIGLVFIYSSTIYSTDSTFAVKQLFFGLIGWFLYFMCARQPEDFWIKNNTNILKILF